MAKPTTQYRCRECGAIAKKWAGQCIDCKAWNTLDEEAIVNAKENKPSRGGGYAGVANRDIVTLDKVETQEKITYSTGLSEFDRALGSASGKGVVKGSVVLIGGDPGIGKSTLLLQTIANLSATMKTLYISGEESAEQVSLRGQRLNQDLSKFSFLSETEVETILATLQQFKPEALVIDSIQTVFTSSLSSAPGSVSQIRESAAALVRYAKQTGCTVFVVGHVTKEGAIAGPRVLEHMVDAVLYFEGETASKFRLLRVVKNRFGAVNELGIFAMTERGLKGISNPSAIFLSGHEEAVSGSVILVSWEGSRAILVELQALVDDAHGHPKRVTIGLEQSRLTMLLAVLSRHCGVVMGDQDVYANVVGGVKVTETASDLALLFACVSSFRNRIIDRKTIVFGEVGLAGEIRPVPNGEDRIIAAAKQGFTRAIVPHANKPRKAIKGMEVIAVKRVDEALGYL